MDLLLTLLRSPSKACDFCDNVAVVLFVFVASFELYCAFVKDFDVCPDLTIMRQFERLDYLLGSSGYEYSETAHGRVLAEQELRITLTLIAAWQV